MNLDYFQTYDFITKINQIVDRLNLECRVEKEMTAQAMGVFLFEVAPNADALLLMVERLDTIVGRILDGDCDAYERNDKVTAIISAEGMLVCSDETILGCPALRVSHGRFFFTR